MRTELARGSAPRCPFCGAELKRPEEISIGPGDTVQGGTCGCGALYVVDPTGKNVGEVMAQALGMAAEKLSKDVSELMSGDDYEDAVLSYDWRLHRSRGPSKGYMDGYGRLYIVKPKKKTACPGNSDSDVPCR